MFPNNQLLNQSFLGLGQQSTPNAASGALQNPLFGFSSSIIASHSQQQQQNQLLQNQQNAALLNPLAALQSLGNPAAMGIGGLNPQQLMMMQLMMNPSAAILQQQLQLQLAAQQATGAGFGGLANQMSGINGMGMMPGLFGMNQQQQQLGTQASTQQQTQTQGKGKGKKNQDASQNQQQQPQEAKSKEKAQKPKKCQTPYIAFVTTSINQIKAQNPGIEQPKVMKKASEIWNSYTEEQKQPFVDMANKDKIRHQNESLMMQQQAFIQNPGQVNGKQKRGKQSNQMQQANNNSPQGQQTQGKVKRERKGGITSFMVFSKQMREKYVIENPKMTQNEVMSRSAQDWKNLSEDQKNQYKLLADKVNVDRNNGGDGQSVMSQGSHDFGMLTNKLAQKYTQQLPQSFGDTINSVSTDVSTGSPVPMNNGGGMDYFKNMNGGDMNGDQQQLQQQLNAQYNQFNQQQQMQFGQQ
eukprot:403335581